MLRKISITLGLLISVTISAFAQFYEIYPEIEENCPGIYSYFLERSNQDSIEWRVTPSDDATIIFSDNFSATVEYDVPGVYLLEVILIQLDTIVASREVFINGGNTEIDILSGCYEEPSGQECIRVCSGSEMTLQSEEHIGRPPEWEVIGAESTSESGDLLDIVWGEAGFGQVILVSSDTTCSSSDTLCVDIFDAAIADFSTTPASVQDTLRVCRNEAVEFVNESENGFSFQWNMGDGTTYNLNNVVHSYSTAGNYRVSLQVDGVCDCDDSKEIFVIVEDGYIPALDCISPICPETELQYSLLQDTCSSIEWSVSNGTITSGGEAGDNFITVEWGVSGTGVITADYSNCNLDLCDNTVDYSIPIISEDGPVSGQADVCGGNLITYTAPYYQGTEYEWSISGNGTIVYDENRNYITVRWANVSSVTNAVVSVSYNNCLLECGGSDDLMVTIRPSPAVIADNTVCIDGTASAQAFSGMVGGSPVAVDWTLEDESGNLVDQTSGPVSEWNYTFNIAAGTYYWVTTGGINGVCDKEIRRKIIVLEQPLVPLGISGVNEICPNSQYSFSIENAGDYGTLWQITDGTNTVEKKGNSVTHTFGNSAPYEITVWHYNLNNEDCLSDPFTKSLQVVSFDEISGPDESCDEEIETFSLPYKKGVEYNWTLSDDTKAEIQLNSLNEVTVFFTEAGTVDLQVMACNVNLSKTITVHPKPVLTINHPDSLCKDEAGMVSSNQSSGGFQWYSENGALVSASETPSLMPGTYYLEYTNDNGCSTKKQFTIYPRISPVAEITADSDPIFIGSDPDLNLIASYNPGYTFEWFRNGASTGATDAVLNVTQEGDYYFVVTNASGCTATSETIQVIECTDCGTYGPSGTGCAAISHDFDLQIDPLTCTEVRYFFDNSNVVAGSEVIRIREFASADSELLFGNDEVYNYSEPGIFLVTAFGELSGFGYPPGTCIHFESIVDTIEAVAEFEYDKGCIGETTYFYDRSRSLPFTEIISYDWNFDDPGSGSNTSNMANPEHDFSAAGSYDVSLTITTNSGCTHTFTQTVEYGIGPDFQLSFDMDNCENELAEFSINDNLFNPQWNFDDPASGDENTAGESSVYHTYSSPGNYTVTYTAEDINGCSYSENASLEIHANTLTGNIAADPGNSACEGDTITLTAPAGEFWTWNNSETNQSIKVDSSGEYRVLVRDSFNCSYSPEPVFAEILPKPALQVYARELGGDGNNPWERELSICYGTEVEIRGFSDVTGSYYWSTGAITQALIFNDENNNLLDVGDHEFDVAVQDIVTGCFSDTLSIQIEVFPQPDQPIISLVSGNACSYNENEISVTNPVSGVEYEWSTGHVGLNIFTSSAGTYYVTAINSNGCTSRSEAVVVDESALVDKIPFGCIEVCELDSICLPSLENVASYTIYENGDVYEQGTEWPDVFVPGDFADYWFEVESDNGCIATSGILSIMQKEINGEFSIPVYFDVDKDSIFNMPPDTAMPEIVVDAQHLSSGNIYTDTTDVFGIANYENVPGGDYLVYFKQMALDSNYITIIDSVYFTFNSCDSTFEGGEEPYLFLGEFCEVFETMEFTICPGDSVEVRNQVFSDTGSYEIMVSGICDTTINVTINTYITDELEILGLPPLQDGETANLTNNFSDSLNYSFNWQPTEYVDCQDCPETEFLGSDSTLTIFLEVITPESCMLYDSITIEILPPQLYIPNAFTPNGDAVNDNFKPYVGGEIDKIELNIFDRWGNRLYQEINSSGEFIGWNGKKESKECSPGIYLYTVIYENESGQLITKKGDLTLLK